jgi:diguanylate cyclase (GGDEF)-like protein/PAS domain S-box-containing protein
VPKGVYLVVKLHQEALGPVETSELASLARLATTSYETLEREFTQRIALLERRLRGFEVALDNISEGISVFDREERLVYCNRRFSEIHRIAPDISAAGLTLSEILDRFAATNTAPMEPAAYLALIRSFKSNPDVDVLTKELPEGRRLQIFHRSIPGGGWVSIHQDSTAFGANQLIANVGISLQALIDMVPDYLWVKDTESRLIVANRALAADSGRQASSEMIGLTDFDLHAPELAAKFQSEEREIMRTGRAKIDVEEPPITDATGAQKWFASTKVPLRNDQNEVFGLIGIARDITARKKADALRDGQAQILEMIATNAPLEDVLGCLMLLVESQLAGIFASVLLLDSDGQHLRHGAAPNLAGDYVAAMDGIRIGPYVGSCGTAAYRRERVIVSDILQDPLWSDYRYLAEKHEYRSCWSTPILSHHREVLGVFAMYSKSVREPTEEEIELIAFTTRIAGIAIARKRAEDQIYFMANHDALTGLPNRALLEDRLEQAILYAERYNRWVTVVFIDLDNFKPVNDTLGHNAGDMLLKTVANRLTGCLRAHDTVVRLGGDEFVVVLFDQPADIALVSQTIQRLREAITEPVELDGHRLTVTASIGIANCPKDGETAAMLLANADAAMYHAKELGRGGFQFYSPDLNISARKNLVLQQEVRDAVARSEFILLYQPEINLTSGEIFAVEALIRWNHPTRGIISPIEFIPLAEETGLIVSIGDWVLHEACRQNKAWQDAGLPRKVVSVNVSARQFTEKNLVARVVHALEETGLEGKYLQLEVTESLIMRDVEAAVAVMKELQRLGVQIAIDDFGTGYSSLSTLKAFPAVQLKIDRSFVKDIIQDANDQAVATTVIELARKLNLRVIAEGVETAEQVAFLRDHDCEEMQGYYFCKPVTAPDVEKLLQAGGTTDALPVKG